MDSEQHDEQRAEKNGSRWPIGRRGFVVGAAAGVLGLGATKLALESQRDGPTGDPDETTADWYGEAESEGGRKRRREYLEKLIPLLHLDADDDPISDPRLSREHPNWRAWLDDTGELPPDFERLPATAGLPDPLRRGEGGDADRIDTIDGWERQRERIGDAIQHWLYGSMPPVPDDLQVTELRTLTVADGTATQRGVRLEFGPDYEATMTVQVMIPEEREGPFPVFMTQWNHREWAYRALERGYIGVVYAGADARDDTGDYGEHYPDHDFQILARRAWGAQRVVDYLLTLEEVDDDRIGLTGFSRNGKQALITAAFDDRISAVAPAGSGTGGALPARFDRDNFFSGHMGYHARVRRSWFHPRWRFFVGRENRLPVDANSLVSMVAPRACMIDVSMKDLNSNAWAIERVYKSALPVYELYDAEDALAVHYRQTGHEMPLDDVEAIVDFFDYAFGREEDGYTVDEYVNPSRFNHEFSFDEWSKTSAAEIDLEAFPERGIDDLLVDENGTTITTTADWEAKKPALRETIRWSFGDRTSADGAVVGRPDETDTIGKVEQSPSDVDGPHVQSDLFYPRSQAEEDDGASETGDATTAGEELPAIVWLHPYSYGGGYGTGGGFREPLEFATDRGFAFASFDQIGFGTRTIDGQDFYDRYPNWSTMGKMVADTQVVVDRLIQHDSIDSDRIYLVGYSLGATAGLYTAALDERIRGVASVCGFSPFRLSDPEKERANAVIGRHSHIHGHHPRLGLFRDEPERMPFDFHEVLGLVAPRPLLVWAPELDWDHPQEDVVQCVEEARAVYDLYGAADALELRTPYDINSFDYHEARLRAAGHSDPPPRARREAVFDWVAEDLP
ncbi:alpha/beta fold hydrolase [Saliphagus sp. GCM10025334]